LSILKSDIKLQASERLTDYDDGGGSMTGNEVVSGELNNLFPDISRLDRVYGRVSLRKCFPAIMTDNQDMYYGSHAIITDPPADDNVYVTMFTTDDFEDVRSNAQDRMESYITIAEQMQLYLMNDQLEGQRAITCFQLPTATYPEVSETICLNDGNTTQYVRLTGIEVSTQQFTLTDNTTFLARVIIYDLSAPLQKTFSGESPTNKYISNPSTKLHKTVVSDASRYYGVSKVTEAISQGDSSFKVDTIYNQLVPTSQIESPLVDQIAGGGMTTMYAKGVAGSMTFSESRSNSSPNIYLPDGVLPGSLDINIAGYDFTDVNGKLVPVDGDGGFEGVVDYANGNITIVGSSWSGTVSLSATPAFPVYESPYTTSLVIELENRSYNYTPNLQPLPRPGTIYVDYMAQGKWYRLYDDGRGILTADEDGLGTGTIDYALKEQTCI
jgi:hypothetical protein